MTSDGRENRKPLTHPTRQYNRPPWVWSSKDYIWVAAVGKLKKPSTIWSDVEGV
jgi:hypothetical protein